MDIFQLKCLQATGVGQFFKAKVRQQAFDWLVFSCWQVFSDDSLIACRYRCPGKVVEGKVFERSSHGPATHEPRVDAEFPWRLGRGEHYGHETIVAKPV